MLAASTGTPRAFWDKIITRISVDTSATKKLPNWSVKQHVGIARPHLSVVQ